MEKTIDSPQVKEILDKHDIKKDKRYYSEEDEELYAALGNLIARGPIKDDRRVYIARAGVKGWGLFSDTVIPKGQLIDVYTGIRRTDAEVTDYEWNYQSRPKLKGKKVYIGTDAREEGNWVRFVNDDKLGRYNLEMIAIPYQNRWYTLYVASRDIDVGEELLVSYGSSYWKRREFL